MTAFRVIWFRTHGGVRWRISGPPDFCLWKREGRCWALIGQVVDLSHAWGEDPSTVVFKLRGQLDLRLHVTSVVRSSPRSVLP